MKYYQIHSKSFEKHKAKSDKELWEVVKKKGFSGLLIDVKTSLKKSDDKLFHAVFSTERKDRHGEIVYQDWDLKNFKKNPVYLDSHNYSSIDFIIGKVHKLKIKDKKLEGDIEFAKSNPRGLMAYNMAEEGFINTSSVGFTPNEFDKNGNIIKAELLEISAVGVPANPEALYEKYDTNGKNKKSDTKDKCNACSSQEERIKDIKEEKEEKEEIEEVKEDIKEGDNDKQAPGSMLKKAIQREIDIKKKAISKISQAIKLVCEKTNGRNSSKEDRADINSEINKAIRNLLKLKIK